MIPTTITVQIRQNVKMNIMQSRQVFDRNAYYAVFVIKKIHIEGKERTFCFNTTVVGRKKRNSEALRKPEVLLCDGVVKVESV